MSFSEFSNRATLPGEISLHGHPSDCNTSPALELSRMELEQAQEGERQCLEKVDAAIVCSSREEGDRHDIETTITMEETTTNSSTISLHANTSPRPLQLERPSGRRICGLTTTCWIVCAWLLGITAVLVPVAITLKKRSNPIAGQAILNPPSSPAPTYDRFAALSSIIKEAAPDVTVLSTLQRESLAWLANEDPANLPLDSDPTTVIERFVLILLYHATDGFFWDGPTLWDPKLDWNENWLSDKHVSEWSGIDCSDGEQITTLRLVAVRGLDGTLPTELGLLTNLKRLHIVGKSIFDERECFSQFRVLLYFDVFMSC
jgi:hypothetical protein